MPSLQMNALKFTDMISKRGMPVKWERAQKCTCWDEYAGQPSTTCKACNGFGYIYDEPVYEDQVLVMSLILNKEFTQIGEYKMGDCIATIPELKKVKNTETGLWEYPKNPLYDIGEFDKITLMSTEFRSTDVLIKGQSMYGREADTLRNPDVTQILRVLKADPITGDITVYSKDINFTVDGNKINWITGLADGEKYSVMYYHRPIYLVYTQLPQSRDQDGQHFPKKVVLRYKDVI